MALLLRSKLGWRQVLSRILIILVLGGIILGGWFLIDLYDETQDFIELRNRYEQSK
ncbi:MAG: hypothetical protein WD512_00375 [Candidatus Paceibacterota bacterium]